MSHKPVEAVFSSSQLFKKLKLSKPCKAFIDFLNTRGSNTMHTVPTLDHGNLPPEMRRFPTGFHRSLDSPWENGGELKHIGFAGPIWCEETHPHWIQLRYHLGLLQFDNQVESLLDAGNANSFFFSNVSIGVRGGCEAAPCGALGLGCGGCDDDKNDDWDEDGWLVGWIG